MGSNRIPLSEIAAYLDILQITDQEAREDYMRFVAILDDEFLKHKKPAT